MKNRNVVCRAGLVLLSLVTMAVADDDPPSLKEWDLNLGLVELL